ncbi:MAG: S8 family serine peptidase [Myxococcota bacterium]
MVLPVFLFACGVDGATPDDAAPTVEDALHDEAGPRMYIVQLQDDVDPDETLDELSARHGARVQHRYRHALHGGALHLTDEAAAELAHDPRVLRVERDHPVYAVGNTPERAPTGYRLIGADVTNNEGAGVHVAVLDTGIDLTHKDLATNVVTQHGRDCINESGAPMKDNNGHGSHVAGTIAAVDNEIGSLGVATAARVVPVKVLNRTGAGSWASVICGIDHVTAHASVLRVANMSLGGPGSECTTGGCTRSALQVAIERSVAAGVTYVVAAGNSGTDARTFVPAAYDAVITVSAYRDTDGVLTSDDGWPSFTNYGADVDIAAPGVSIFSTYKSGGYKTLSGTSMASPHVAAAAAMLLSTHPLATPSDVRTELRARALTVFPGSTNTRHAEPLLDVRSGFPAP